jgi:hypothetical protein
MAQDIFKDKGDAALREQISLAAFTQRCPHLGMKDDPATILGFPNAVNHCFRHKKLAAVDLKTQSILCLTSQFDSCAVFQHEIPLESEKAVGSQRVWVKRARPAALIIPLILLVVAALIWWPAPGTSIEDSSGKAAPMQEIATREVSAPAASSQPGPQSTEVHQTEGLGDLVEIDAAGEQEEAAIDVKNIAPSTQGESTDQKLGGFRVRAYD